MTRVIVFNATSNNISVISWGSVLFIGGNQSTRIKPLTCLIDTLHHIMLYQVHLTMSKIQTHPKYVRINGLLSLKNTQMQTIIQIYQITY